ncbi:MAG: hypothetical protein CMQ15_09285 [Gammaproteobacteria bacterium]|jgi:hypothetical protein|nr:hypothetical protein [Gammaproteobacteria bacterium]MBT72214.1 hypothetical protein [Gammaproteobacteria bacterium]HJN96082.1 DUF6644 family protein [Gammaproteobacteria bacterium]|tara:strand:- start:1186 stop:1713 length:528 start_codon:yes stop_codon:yes gene_type:complete
MPEFFTSMGGLLSGSFLQAGALWALRNIPGFPPIIQTVHILGIAVVMGSVVLLDLRILGLAVPSQKISEMSRRVMPWFWWALASNFVSGSFFLFGRPNRYFNNPIFGWKLSFLIPAILLTLFFHLMSKAQTDYWELNSKRLWTARAIALLSLGLWIMVAMAGRWIAYSEYIYFPA